MAIKGPIAIAIVIDNPKIPIPSPLRFCDTKSTAIVDPAVLIEPQVSPCKNRSTSTNKIDVAQV